MKIPPIDISEANMTYLRSLKPGERVIEMEKSNCMYGTIGTVYLNDKAQLCVLWDENHKMKGRMGTSVTHGTRRLEDSGLPTDQAGAKPGRCPWVTTEDSCGGCEYWDRECRA